MSWLSKATGIHLGNIGGPIGGLIGSVIPGVGTALGAGVGQGLGSLGSKKPIGQAVASGLGAYGTARAAGAGGGNSPTPTFPSSVIRSLSGFMPGPAGVPPIGGSGAPSTDSNWLQQLLGGAGDILGKGVQYAKDNPMNVALGGLAAAQGVQSAKASARSAKYQDKGLSLADANWAEKAPLRAQSMERLLHPPKVDLSATFTNPTNPFSGMSPSQRPLQRPEDPSQGAPQKPRLSPHFITTSAKPNSQPAGSGPPVPFVRRFQPQGMAL